MKTTTLPNPKKIRDYVRARYGAIAEQAGNDAPDSCCGGASRNHATACCVADETAKAEGRESCGCGATPILEASAAGGCCGAISGGGSGASLGRRTRRPKNLS